MNLVDQEAVDLDIVSGNDSSSTYKISGFRSLSQRDYWDFGDYNITVNISNLVRYMLNVEQHSES